MVGEEGFASMGGTVPPVGRANVTRVPPEVRVFLFRTPLAGINEIVGGDSVFAPEKLYIGVPGAPKRGMYIVLGITTVTTLLDCFPLVVITKSEHIGNWS